MATISYGKAKPDEQFVSIQVVLKTTVPASIFRDHDEQPAKNAGDVVEIVGGTDSSPLWALIDRDLFIDSEKYEARIDVNDVTLQVQPTKVTRSPAKRSSLDIDDDHNRQAHL